MNIGFYGKGGSGKTTLSALFATYLDSKDYTVGLLDVDVNSHTAEILGVTEAKDLSLPEHKADIYRYLAGENPRVRPNEFLNTTPPGPGSSRWSMDADNYLTKTYGRRFGKQSHIFTVGSYTPDRVGVDCHHGAQKVAENMISHAMYGERDVLVVDSVAGNDAFGTTLFLNDVLIFVVKPEREGVAVLKRFIELAEQAGVADRVLVVGNLASHSAQVEFLQREVPADTLLGILPSSDTVMQRRLDGQPLGMESVGEAEAKLFDTLLVRCQKLKRPLADRHEAVLDMHKKVASEAWVAGAYRAGLVDQIDEAYQP